MAVSEMNFISIIGNMKNIDEIVNICGESGVFQPDNVFTFYSDTEGFTAISEENPYSEPFQVLGNAVSGCGGKLFDVDIKNFHVSRSKTERYVSYFSGFVNKKIDEKRSIYQEISGIKEEIKILKLIVEQFLAFAEAQAASHVPMYMKDWVEHLKMVLTMNRKSILEDAGRISHQMALEKAEIEYNKYRTSQLQMEHLKSIKELEDDIRKLNNDK